MLEDRKKLLVGAAAAASGVTLVAWAVARHRRRNPSIGHSPTDFESYLKARIDNPSLQIGSLKNTYAPTSFEAYLKHPDALESGSQAESSFLSFSNDTSSTTANPAPPDSKPVVILYGTEFGFSREVAEKLCQRLHDEDGSYWPQMLDMAAHPSGLPLDACQALLVTCSTQGDGVPPTEAREFCTWLLGSKAPRLEGVLYSVCALGDRSYAHFARCGKSVDARLATLGASRVAPRADINKEDWTAINLWIDNVVKGLADAPLRTVAELGGFGELDINEENSSGETYYPQQRWVKSRPYLATVVALEGLCEIQDAKTDKNTVRVELDLGDSGLEYLPGDAIGVWPTNDPSSVTDLLAVLGVDGDVRVQLPSWHYKDASLPAEATSIRLEDALLRCYDLRSPKPELLVLLARKLSVATTRLSNTSNSNGLIKGNNENGTTVVSPTNGNGTLTNGGHDALCAHGCVVDAADTLQTLLKDTAACELYLSERHVIDVLRDWRAAALTPAELLSVLRQLAPRLYSISSSPLENPSRVQITVAVVKYTSLSIERRGVASTCLGERLAPGSPLPVYMYPNPEFKLPSDIKTPIIMVGPGTGLAPFRAFLQHRVLLSSRHSVQSPSPSPGRALLYFGCRRRDQDYLYRELLERWDAEGVVSLHTAFSREQGHKVYVQDRLRETWDDVWALLESGAHFYICGDGAHMAVAVEEALLEIVEKGQGQGHEMARQYVDALKESGRLQKDVWTT